MKHIRIAAAIGAAAAAIGLTAAFMPSTANGSRTITGGGLTITVVNVTMPPYPANIYAPQPSAVAHCPTGTVVTGGGAFTGLPGGGGEVINSYPQGNGWFAQVGGGSGANPPWPNGHVYAVCAHR